jgi:hypothetical protein
VLFRSEEVILIPAGFGAEVRKQIQKKSSLTVHQIWRGLHPLNDGDIVSGETLDVEYSEFPRTMLIHLVSENQEPIETLVRPIEEFLRYFRLEYGWSNRTELFLSTGAKRITAGTNWLGASLLLRGIEGRVPMNRVTYPNETEPVQIPYEKGSDILKHIQEQVGAEVFLRVVEEGVLPCSRPFLTSEEYHDVGLEMTLRTPLPVLAPVEHQDMRFPTYRERRELDLWLQTRKLREDYAHSQFIHASDSRYQLFWKQIDEIGRKAEDDLVKETLPNLNPETINRVELRKQAMTALAHTFDVIAQKYWSEDQQMQEALQLDQFTSKVFNFALQRQSISSDRIQNEIQKRCNLWTENREQTFTTMIQAMDTADTTGRSQRIWNSIFTLPLFRNVQESVIVQHRTLTRSLCLDEDTIEIISWRCWRQFQFTDEECEAKDYVEYHLSQYGKIKDIVMNRIVT